MISLKVPNIKDLVFKQIHTRNLVYNTCWEDPRCDRNLLRFKPDSKIVMITSAGCNALDYLLNNPQKIDCIDMNPRQNALLELKQSFFKCGDYEHLFKFFGEGYYKGASNYYRENLRDCLKPETQKYWDKNIHYFNGKNPKKTFYFKGTSGLLAGILLSYMKTKPHLHNLVVKLFEANSLEEQRETYQLLEPLLFSDTIKWLLNRHITISLAGVPRPQQKLITKTYEKEGIAGYVKDCLRHVFCHIPVQNNYFWYVYVFGKYTKSCCPEYLKEGNFEQLKGCIHKISTHTSTVSNFLEQNPESYSHYILLDHQDWLAAHDVPALEEEWKLILQNSSSGTKVLQRSAANTISFFPDFVKEQLTFEEESCAKWHINDRVGTYGSVYVGIKN